MKTVYFPYTHIDPRRAEQMAAILGPVTLLQPSPETCLPETAALQVAGVIETVFPASDAQESLNDVLQDLKQWAAQHTGGNLAVMMEQRQTIPFFSSQSSAQMVAEIRKGGKTPEEDPAADYRKKVFQAQLLLAMAQEFDLQQAALARDIAALSAKESEMMALLKGEAVADTGSMTPAWAPLEAGSAAMIALRLKAWARALAAVEGMEILTGDGAEILFLTDGRGVLAQIQEMFPEAERRVRFNRLARWRPSPHEIERLPSWLIGLLTPDGEEASGVDRGPLFGRDLVEIPRMSVAAFLIRLAGRTHHVVSDGLAQTASESCWIGCLTLAGDDNRESVGACELIE